MLPAGISPPSGALDGLPRRGLNPLDFSLDIVIQVHQDAKMRTTIDLPDDLHRIVTSLATHTRSSLSQTAADLIRRGLALPTRDADAPAVSTHAVTGLPVLQSSRSITPEDVKALDDEG